MGAQALAVAVVAPAGGLARPAPQKPHDWWATCLAGRGARIVFMSFS